MLTTLPMPVLTFGLFVALGLVSEFGFLLHSRLGRFSAAEKDDSGYVLSAALGLLALLLAFTFSLALSRYDHRREVVVGEANAIGTAWLRATLVEGPGGAALAGELARYAQSRLALTDAGENPPALVKAEAACADLRTRIWSDTVAATAPIRTTAQAASLTDSVNSVIDYATTRKAALEAHVPPRVMMLLIAYALVSALIMGYARASREMRGRVITLGVFALLALTIGLIVDLDRPHGGAIRVSQQPMIDLVADIAKGDVAAGGDGPLN